MIATRETVLTKDLANKKIKVTREFDAPVAEVWKAWTEPELLDKWWAPKPWKAITVSMDFRPNGKWNYYMQGPDDTKHYCLFAYSAITANKSYSGEDAFTDENGKVNGSMPQMNWNVNFNGSGDSTKVNIDISFNSVDDLNKIIEMGFEEGFAAAHKNLDDLLTK
jgi:uncharacterized protein YndB with AHSA1/START domain